MNCSARILVIVAKYFCCLFFVHNHFALCSTHLQKLALCRARVTHHTNIDVTTQLDALLGGLVNTPKRLQQNASFHLFVAKHRWRYGFHELGVEGRSILHGSATR